MVAAGLRPQSPVLERGYPFIGILPDILRDPPETLARIGHRHHGKVASFQIGPFMTLLVSYPAHVQQLLIDNARDFEKGGVLWKPMRLLVGDGLATSHGPTWRRARRMLQPLFSAKGTAAMVSVVQRHVDVTLERLLAMADRGETADVELEMMGLGQRILFELTLGDDEHGEADELRHAIAAAFQALSPRVFLNFLPDRFPWPGHRTFRRSLDAVDAIIFGAIRRRRERPGVDLLSMLISAQDEGTGESMTDRQLRDEIVTLFLAGSETTAVALTWLWFLLDEHPDVAQRAREEIGDVIGDETPSAEAVSRLSYTKLIVQETLRLFPPGWITSRRSVRETEIGGQTIPEGTTVLLSPFVTHRDPELWESPEAFDPERFLPDRRARLPRFAYYPFGGGARQCIGMNPALMEMELALVRMLPKLRMRRVDRRPVELHSRITLRPRDGLVMSLSRIG